MQILDVLTILIAIAIPIGVLAVLIRAVRTMPRGARAKWAYQNGLRFVPGKDYTFAARYGLFKCLQRGDNRYAYNIFVGTCAKRWTCAFDCHYEITSERDTEHHHFSAVVVDSGLQLKPLFIRPEGFLDRLPKSGGTEDTNFESIEFNRKFFVSSPDRRWAYDVLHQKAMELLLMYPNFQIDFQGREVMAYYDDKTFSEGDFTAALRVLTGIVDYLPESVVREHRIEPAGDQGLHE